jgi:hypothetical protein
MKLHLQWVEKFEMVREYPTFTLTAQEYPELELEIQRVYDAEDTTQGEAALADLKHKMGHSTHRGETIIDFINPWDQYAEAEVYVVPGEAEGFLKISDVDGSKMNIVTDE